MNSGKKLKIRSSTAEFLIFELDSKESTLEVRYEEGTVWLTQKMMSELFGVESHTITYHLQEIFKTQELEPSATTRKFRVVQIEGTREVQREIDHYNLDAVISVGYRVNSKRATQFRRWATHILQQFAIKGYIIDRKRMENGVFLGEDYFERLLEEIREIRLSERRFYQKVTDIYATSVDYDSNAPTTKLFFSTVQNKLHFAVSEHTAAEIIFDRADSSMEHMGLRTWDAAPDGKILRTDVVVAKNYLDKNELDALARLVNSFLDLAEDFAKRRIPMTMEDWAKRLDGFLLLTGRPVLENAGKISTNAAKQRAYSEFEKYRIIQDRCYISDFDRHLSSNK